MHIVIVINGVIPQVNMKKIILNYKVNLPGFGVCVLTETSPPATNIKNITIFIWQWQIKGWGGGGWSRQIGKYPPPPTLAWRTYFWYL